MRVRSIVTAVVVVLLAGQAAAQGGALYAGEPASPEAASRAATLLSLLSPPVYLDEAPQHVEAWIPQGPLAVIGATSSACMGAAVHADAYRAELEQLYGAIVSMQDTAERFERVRRSQACLTELVTPAELARVDFLAAVTAFSDGREHDAEVAFQRVFAVDPDHAWDDDFPPPAQHLFIDARAAVSRQRTVPLQFLLPPGTGAWVNGRSLMYGRCEIHPGRHLVQIRGAGDEPCRGVVLDVHGAVLVVDTRAFDAPTPVALAGATSALLGARAAAGEDVPHHLVLLGEDATVWRWHDISLVPVAVPAAAQAALYPDPEPVTGRPGAATGVLIAMGAGLTAVGAVVTGLATGDLNAFEQDVEGGLVSFPRPTAEDPTAHPGYQQWQELTRRTTAGYALLGAGGACLMASIPVGIASSRQPHQIAVTAAFQLDPATDRPGGLLLGVSVR